MSTTTESQDSLSQYIQKWGSRVSYVHTEGSTADVEGPDEAAWEFLKVAHVERVSRRQFTRRINVVNGKFWRWDEDILKAETLNGRVVQKFSWNPNTGEFLLVSPGQNHASAMQKAKAPFDDYIRGIILPQQGKVTFRPFYPTWMQNRSVVQQFHGGGEDASEVSFDAQHAAEKALKANGSKGWTFQYNISNKMLEEMTGKHFW